MKVRTNSRIWLPYIRASTTTSSSRPPAGRFIRDGYAGAEPPLSLFLLLIHRDCNVSSVRCVSLENLFSLIS